MYSRWRTRRPRAARLPTGLALLLLLFLPGRATADPDVCRAEPGPMALAQAREAQAGDRIRTGRSLARAAAFLEEAARLRPRCDIRGFEDLRLASRLYDHAGKVGRARDAMLAAADAAVWTGNVLAAAHAYLDGAILAARTGRDAAARDAVEKARSLSASPFLSPRERLSILDRIREREELALG